MRRLIALASLSIVLLSCQKKQEDGHVSLTLPSSTYQAKSSSKSISANAIDFSRVCYMAAVTGGAVEKKRGTSACYVDLGIHSEFKLPSATVTLDLPRSTGYTVTLFAYTRTSSVEPCPKMTDSIGSLNLSRVYKVASSNFDLVGQETTVELSVVDPGVSLVADTSYSLPASCAIASVPTSGAVLTSPNGFKLSLPVAAGDGRVLDSANLRLVLRKDGSR